MPPASVELLAISPPFVKADAVCLPVVLGRGGRAVISASPALWRSIFQAFGFSRSAELSLPVSAAPAPARRLHRRGPQLGTTPQARLRQQAIYQRILQQSAADPARSLVSICEDNGVEVDRFYGWKGMQLARSKNPVPEILAIRRARFGSEEIPVMPAKNGGAQ